MKIEINDKVYDVKVAETDQDFETGLQDITSLPENEGMLFPYEEESEVTFWMKDTLIPLDIIFVNEDEEVVQVSQGIPNSEEYISGIAKYVIELNVNSGVEIGDEVDFEDDIDDVEIKSMYVLGSDGKPQMEIVGGERIFSRKNTKTLIKMAKRAYKNKSDKYYKALGKKAFKYLDIQDNNDPEYVSLS